MSNRTVPTKNRSYQVDGRTVARSVIPDSAIHHYPTADFSTSEWPDSIGTSDIDTIDGLTFDSDAFGGDGGVVGDGTDNYGQSDSMGSFGSSLSETWAIAIRFTTADSGILAGVREGNSPLFQFGFSGFESSSPDELSIQIRDENANTIMVESNRQPADGSDQKAIIQKEASGGDANDIRIYFDATDFDSSIVLNDSFGNTLDFTRDMAYYAWNNDGTIGENISATMRGPYWFNDSLNESERSAVFEEL